jgi:predicted aspartyl protease
MKKRNVSKSLIRSFILCFGFIALAQFCTVTGSAGERIKFSLHRGFGIVVPVFVNEKGPFKFLLDTGSNTTIVSAEFARRLELRAIDRIELATPAGVRIVLRSALERATIGTVSAQAAEVLVNDLDEIKKLDAEICGVLGQNILSRFNFLLDYTNRSIELEEGEEIERRICGERISIEWNEGRPLIHVRSLQGGRNSARLLLDSGVPAMVLFRRKHLLNALSLSSPERLGYELRTDTGSIAASQARLRPLAIGDLQLVELTAAFVEALPADRVEDGLLPTNLFRKLYFNHRKQYVILNPQ